MRFAVEVRRRAETFSPYIDATENNRNALTTWVSGIRIRTRRQFRVFVMR